MYAESRSASGSLSSESRKICRGSTAATRSDEYARNIRAVATIADGSSAARFDREGLRLTADTYPGTRKWQHSASAQEDPASRLGLHVRGLRAHHLVAFGDGDQVVEAWGVQREEHAVVGVTGADRRPEVFRAGNELEPRIGALDAE